MKSKFDSYPKRAVTVIGMLALFCAPLSAQLAWTGNATAGDLDRWNNPGNWSFVGPIADGDSSGTPNTNLEIARFDTVSANNVISMNTGTTTSINVNKIEFLPGAGSYTLIGGPGAGNGTIITSTVGNGNNTVDHLANLSGINQTINSSLSLAYVTGATGTTGSRTINTGPAGTLTFGGLVSASGGSDRNFLVIGQGTLTFSGTFNTISASGPNVITQDGSSVVNFNITNTANLTYSRITSANSVGRVNYNVSTTRAFSLGGATSGSGRVYITTDGVTVGTTFPGSGNLTAQEALFRGGSSINNTLGVDVPGTGNGTVGAISIQNANLTNAKHNLSAAADDTLILSGVIRSVSSTGNPITIPGAGTALRIVGPGVVRFTGNAANTAAVPIEVASGRLELGKDPSQEAVGVGAGTVSVLSSGELRLLNNSQINDAVGVVLSGGTLNLNGMTETLGTLSVTAASTLALGTTGTVAFADSHLLDWLNSPLNITGTFAPGSSIRFGVDATGLSETQLALITVNGTTPVLLNSSGYLVANTFARPTNFAASATSGTQVSLTWTDAGPSEIGYSLETSVDGGANWTTLANLSANVTTASHTGLTAGATYNYRLRANYSGGSSPFVLASVTTPTLSALNQWRLTNLGSSSNSGDAADGADFDNDGIANLIEYATDATGGNNGSLPVVGTTTVSTENRLTLSFNRIADPALTYAIWASNDLVNWGATPVLSSTGVANVAGIVLYTDTVNLTGSTRRFLRLIVTTP